MWSECSKEEYWNKVHDGGDYVCTSDKNVTIWETRSRKPIAKSSQGYIPDGVDITYWLWSSR